MLLEKDVVIFLRDSLGSLMTAYLIGADSTNNVKTMCQSNTEVSSDVYERVTLAYNVVKKLQAFESDDTIQAFMMGLNPTLGDRAPARVIRNEDTPYATILLDQAVTNFIHN